MRLQQTDEVASGGGQSVSARLEKLSAALRNLPRLSADGVVEVELPAIVAGDTIVRDVVFQIRPDPDQGTEGAAPDRRWQVSGLEAQLPGRTELRADGTLALTPSLGFTGDLALASSQPSGFAKWIGGADDPVISAMANAGFEARANIGNGALTLDDLEIILDGSRLQGALVRNPGDGGRDVIDLALAGEAADFDQLAAWGRLLAGENADTFATGHDLLVDLDVGRAVYDGIGADRVVAKGTFIDDVIDIDLLEIGDLAGVAVSANGRLRRTADFLPTQGSLTIAVSGKRLDEALALLDRRLPDAVSLDRLRADAALYGPMDVVFDVSASDGTVAIEGNGTVGATGLDLGIDYTPHEKMDLRVVLDAANAARMLAQVGTPVSADVDVGRGGLRISASGEPGGPLRSSATLTTRTGFASAEGDLTFAWTDGWVRPSGELNVRMESTDIDPFIAMSGLPVPGYGEGQEAKVGLQLALSQSGFSADNIAGTVAGSSFSGRLARVEDVNGEPVIEGTLAVDTLSGALVAGAVLTDDQLFDGVNGALDVTVAELFWPEGQLASLRDLGGRLSIDGGDLVIEDGRARWLGGDVGGTLSLARSGDSDLLSATLALDNGSLSEVEAALAVPSFMTGRLNGSASFEASAGPGESLASALTGSGSAVISGGRLQGVANDTLANALVAADATADGDLPAQAAAIVRSALGAGGLAFGDTQLSATMAGGVARVENVPLSTDGVTGIGRARYDLTDGTYQARIDVTFDPAREAVIGATPALSVTAAGSGNDSSSGVDTTAFEAFLNMRLAERREREFAAQQASIAQRQRIADTVRLYQLKARARQRAEEEAARRAEEARLEQERRRAEVARALELAQQARQQRAEREEREREALEREEELRLNAQEAQERLIQGDDAEPVLDFRSLEGID